MKDEEIRRELEQKRVELLEMPADHVNILARNVGSLGGYHHYAPGDTQQVSRATAEGGGWPLSRSGSQDWTLVRYRILQVR